MEEKKKTRKGGSEGGRRRGREQVKHINFKVFLLYEIGS